MHFHYFDVFVRHICKGKTEYYVLNEYVRSKDYAPMHSSNKVHYAQTKAYILPDDRVNPITLPNIHHLPVIKTTVNLERIERLTKGQ